MATALDTSLYEAVDTARLLRSDIDAYRRNMIAGRVDRDDEWEVEMTGQLADMEDALGIAAPTDAPDWAVVAAEPEAEPLTLF